MPLGHAARRPSVGRGLQGGRYHRHVHPSRQSDYQPLSGVLTQMGPKVVGLIQSLLGSTNVGVLDVSHRVKTMESATKKIDASGGRFETFRDLHDMLGVRVVTYLQSDVEEVVETLSENFDVDAGRSSNKASMLDPDRFGYLSHHLVVKLNGARATLGEYKQYADTYFEIQVRSILQHAWAQIEHDLGYKSPSGIPAPLKRRFARLAGLLETADVEFDALTYEATRHAALVRAVVTGGGKAAIDQDSIHALAMQDGVIRRADLAICAAVGATLEPTMHTVMASTRADELTLVGYSTTEEVEQDVADQFDGLVQFASSWLSGTGISATFVGGDGLDDDEYIPAVEEKYTVLSPGVSLFYLYLHKEMGSENPQDALIGIANLHHPLFWANFKQLHNRIFEETAG